MLRQAYEEAIHTDTFIYCCDSLGLNPDEIYTMYQTIPSIKEKDDFVVELTKSVFDPNFNTIGDSNIQALRPRPSSVTTSLWKASSFTPDSP